MSRTSPTAIALEPVAAERSGTGNVVRLAVAQALAGANSTVVFATGAVVGNMLAPSKVLATLPISIFVVGMAACALPTGSIARRYGRRTVFMVGTGCGVLVGLLSAWAIVAADFWLFCAAMFLGGAYAAVVFSFRFAAADCVPAERRPRALSAVMAGGVFGGVIGPQLVTHTMNLSPPTCSRPPSWPRRPSPVRPPSSWRAFACRDRPQRPSQAGDRWPSSWRSRAS